MAATRTYKHAEIQQLARSENVPSFAPIQPLRKLQDTDVPVLVTQATQNRAEQLLLKQKASKLYRKPSLRTKKRLESYDFKNITAVLPEAIDQGEPVGVIQALLGRAGNVSIVKKAEKRGSETEQRDKLLEAAVRSSNADFVSLLAPQSSQARRNEALAAALTARHEAIVLKLLEYEADPNACTQQFLAAAGQADHTIISLLLRAPRSFQQITLLQSLGEAVKSGSLHTLPLITQAAHLHNVKELPALSECIQVARLDMLLTLLLSARSLSPQFLDSIVFDTFSSADIDAATQAQIVDALLYAGASGDKSAEAFALAVESNSVRTISIFAKHHVNINWNHGKAVTLAVRAGSMRLLKSVTLSGNLAAGNAGRAMKALPRHVEVEERFQIIKVLLDAGAHGSSVDDQLVIAVQNGHQATISLLRERGASLDRNKGDALVESIKSERLETLQLLLRGSVNQESMQRAFPHLRGVSKGSRRQMTKLLLKANVSGEAVDQALRDAVCDHSADRDPELIGALIRGGADPAFSDAQSMRHAIDMKDKGLLKNLLKSPAQVSQGVASSLMKSVTRVEDAGVRYEMMEVIIEAEVSNTCTSEALVAELSRERFNAKAVDLLLSRGNASLDHQGGRSMVLGAVMHDISILNLLMKSQNVSRATINLGLLEVLRHPSHNDAEKAARAAVLLSGRRNTTVSSNGLQAYVWYCQGCYFQGREWPLQTFSILLDAGADVAVDNGRVFASAAKAASISLLELMISRGVPQNLIDKALCQVLSLSDDHDRSDAFQTLLAAGPSITGLSTAMVMASQQKLPDFVRTLLTCAALVKHDNHRTLRLAVSTVHIDLLGVIIESKPSQDSLAIGFEEAIALIDVDARLKTMRAILRAPFHSQIVSQYLIRLVEGDDTPRELVQLLLENGASVHEQRSKSLTLAATKGKLEILKLLFTKATVPGDAIHCFVACHAAGLISAFNVPVFLFLLEMGAIGACLDSALLEAVETFCSAENKDVSLIELFVSHGASTSYADGGALYRACEMGSVEVVTALLQTDPSAKHKSRALHHVVKSTASESDFCKIIDMMMFTRTVDSGGEDSSGRPTFETFSDEFDHPLCVLLKNRPKDYRALRKLFDSDCNISLRYGQGDVLSWAMSLTNPRVSIPCLQILIEMGGNVNHKNLHSGETLILQAMKTGRSPLINPLMRYGADASATDNEGCSPLLYASTSGNARAVSDLLRLGARANDGSLHQATRNLNTDVVKLLLENGHNPNLPSSMHGGRTALGELCFNGKASRSTCNPIAQIIQFLREAGADVTAKVGRKPLICIALDNADPAPMTEAILMAYLHENIDEDFNIYNDGSHCYSPTKYVSHGVFLGPPSQADRLESLLRNHGAQRDIFYCLDLRKRQPHDAVGMPEHIKDLEARRQEEDDAIAKAEEAHQRTIRRENEREAQRQTIENQQHKLHIAQNREAESQKVEFRQKQHNQQLAHQRELQAEDKRAKLEDARWRQHERDAELKHYTDRENVETSARQQRYRLEADNRKQIMYDEQRALDGRIAAQRRLARDQDSYSERQHERNMKELMMARAVPVGAPFAALPPTARGGFIEDVPH